MLKTISFSVIDSIRGLKIKKGLEALLE